MQLELSDIGSKYFLQLILKYFQVADVESAIMARKGEVEKLISDMKSANLESLTISPPEETKAFLDGESAPA